MSEPGDSRTDRPRRAYSDVSRVTKLPRRRKLAIVKGQDSGRYTDIYHAALTAPWSVFLLGLLALFLALNGIFALLYAADPNAISNGRPGNIVDAFIFSIQTIGSNDFSVMTPKSAYAHSVVIFETFTVNYAFLGLVMSLMFARFSRPFARVVFSNVAVIAPFDGAPMLMFRTANQRGNSVLDAEVHVTVARRQVTSEGIVMRRFQELKLERHRTSLFALSWTVMHRIDETSPLYGHDADMLYDNEIEIVVLLSGTDDTLADRIYARHAYTPDDIVWDQRFVDVLSVTPHGMRVVDLTRFHDTVPIGRTDTVRLEPAQGAR